MCLRGNLTVTPFLLCYFLHICIMLKVSEIFEEFNEVNRYINQAKAIYRRVKQPFEYDYSLILDDGELKWKVTLILHEKKGSRLQDDQC